MIEHITPENPLTERHIGMMAVLRNGGALGPILRNIWCDFSFCTWSWNTYGSIYGYKADERDIIAVMPMPDLSGLMEPNGG